MRAAERAGRDCFVRNSARKFLFLKLITKRDRASSYDLRMCSSVNVVGVGNGRSEFSEGRRFQKFNECL